MIWDFAQANGYVILSKDSDFHQLSLLLGAPPKCVWLRCGNASVSELEFFIRSRADAIEAFGEDAEAALLVLDR